MEPALHDIEDAQIAVRGAIDALGDAGTKAMQALDDAHTLVKRELHRRDVMGVVNDREVRTHLSDVITFAKRGDGPSTRGAAERAARRIAYLMPRAR